MVEAVTVHLPIQAMNDIKGFDIHVVVHVAIGHVMTDMSMIAAPCGKAFVRGDLVGQIPSGRVAELGFHHPIMKADHEGVSSAARI